ncbi:tRNA (adenosine(37)-N6)-threonylcarbamoyltransferase complex dimerization subunit type 1 TsaB [Lysobacter sp. D1-1-M9]|uniref:tRNA (adenosine(37)-N6)-threonylcarbamoyltransferase complex dimerization subunit type 1 TsaB n=1 Tax=Novilysobacter longmucuonensis TaxID=3098603 RepID=UPI002FC5E3B9
MKLLAFELATEACSVALWLDGEVRERFEIAPRRHAELALPWAEQLLAEAGIGKKQLDAIAVGRGPGAFTGVRLAIAVAQGIALALDKPVVPVSTLAALAASRQLPAAGEVGAEHRVLAAIDARMGEVYHGAFAVRDGSAVAIGEEGIHAPDGVPVPSEGEWHGRGTGFAAADGLLRRHCGHFASIEPSALPHAAAVARLGAAAFAHGTAVAPDRIEPAYLRNQVALTLEEQRVLRSRR